MRILNIQLPSITDFKGPMAIDYVSVITSYRLEAHVFAIFDFEKQKKIDFTIFATDRRAAIFEFRFKLKRNATRTLT